MKIKKLILLAAVAGLVTACGNSSKKADSANSGEQTVDSAEILRNDSIQKAQADSVAKADAAFAEYQKSGVNISIGKFTVTREPESSIEEGNGYYTLTNNSDTDVAASDYTVTERWTMMACGAPPETGTEIKPGVAIKAHGTAKYPIMFTGRCDVEVVKINTKPKTRKQFDAQYKPTSSQAD